MLIFYVGGLRIIFVESKVSSISFASTDWYFRILYMHFHPASFEFHSPPSLSFPLSELLSTPRPTFASIL